jgi:hypothetical protein
MNDIVDTLVEIEPVSTDAFLKIKETLTRVGIISRKNIARDGIPTLWQSCHILHKQGRYFIVHFKQLFLLDGKNDKTQFLQEDADRTFLIATLLEKWGLIKLKRAVLYAPETKVAVIPYKDKDRFNLEAKYSIGNIREY